MSAPLATPNPGLLDDRIVFVHGYQLDRNGVLSSLAENVLAEATRRFIEHPKTVFVPLSGLDLPQDNPETTVASIMASRLITRGIPQRQVFTQASYPETAQFMRPRDRFEEARLANRLLNSLRRPVTIHFDFMACDFDCARLTRTYRAWGMPNAHPLPVFPRDYPGIRSRRWVAWLARMHQLTDTRGIGAIAREIRRGRTWETGYPLIT